MTKITGAQSHMMTKKYTKFEKDSLKDSREKLRTNPDRQTDGRTDRRTDRQGDSSIPPLNLEGGIKMDDLYVIIKSEMIYNAL